MMLELLIADADGIRRITMNRPSKRNALTRAMYSGMAVALRDAASNPALRSVLLSGGIDCFTSGNDISDFRTRGSEPGEAPSPARDFLEALRECPKPVVAVVGGVAVGIGVTLLLHCDLVYAAEEAVFSLPFVDLGLCPEGGSSLLLPQRAGALLANELFMLASPFDAATALRAGIVNRTVPRVELLSFAEEKVRLLADKPPSAMAATKAMLRHPDEARLAEQMEREFARFGQQVRGEEAAEALAAFIEKRKPDFSRFLTGIKV
jgi:enoyl-CoA hydratase/carnithine racemase